MNGKRGLAPERAGSREGWLQRGLAPERAGSREGGLQRGPKRGHRKGSTTVKVVVELGVVR
jgi:hypothetical protein